MSSNEDDQTTVHSSAFASFPADLKYLLLIVVGEPFSTENVDLMLKEVEKGLKNWDINAEETEYESVLREAVEANVNQIGLVHKSLSCNGSQLGVVALINPTLSYVSTDVQGLLVHPAQFKHIIYGGLVAEGSGDWLLHDDTLTLTDLVEAFADQRVTEALQKPEGEKSTFIVSNCHWSSNVIAKQAFSKNINVILNPSEAHQDLDGISSLADHIRSQVVIPTAFQLLEPPTMGIRANAKINKPTVLVMAAAKGDCAIFAVGDFSILIGGGYSTKSSFWKFGKHLHRVDAILLPHMDPNCLLGVNSFLRRKLSEIQLEQPEPENEGYEEWKTKCNSPELGVIYMNTPAIKKTPSQSLTLKSFAVGAQTVKLAKELDCDVIPCQASSGKASEPITLFQKVGIGRLDMYILSPTQGSRELKDFFTQWSSGKSFTKVKTGVKVNDKDGEVSLLDAVSICSLIVWQPWDKEEDIVRVLYPGNAPQNRIMEGLDRLKHLDFLKYRRVNQLILQNGGKPVPKKKSVKPKANGPVKKVPSPTKEAMVCEDGIHCNTPPPSPTGGCIDGKGCNTPPPGNVCDDGVHCNTPPPDGVCLDGQNCNTPPPEGDNPNVFIPIGKCGDGQNCNTPPLEGDGRDDGEGGCSDGIHCNTPPPEGGDSVQDGKCGDGRNCNTPPLEEDGRDDGEGGCSDGIHCNTPPPEEEDSVQDGEGSADPLEYQGDSADVLPQEMDKDATVEPTLTKGDGPDGEDGDDGDEGHGTAAATPEESPDASPEVQFGDDRELETPPDEPTERVTDANHNLELAIGGASPDVLHDSSGIDTGGSPSPDQQYSWGGSIESPGDSVPILPPDVVPDATEDNEEHDREVGEGAALAEMSSDAVVGDDVLQEDQEESSEDVSQESEIEVKPQLLPEDSHPGLPEEGSEEQVDSEERVPVEIPGEEGQVDDTPPVDDDYAHMINDVQMEGYQAEQLIHEGTSLGDIQDEVEHGEPAGFEARKPSPEDMMMQEGHEPSMEDDQFLKTDDDSVEPHPASEELSPVLPEPESEENLAGDGQMQEGIPQSVEDDQVVGTDFQQFEQHPFHEELSPAAMMPEFEENRAEGAESQEEIQQYLEDDQVLETDDALLEQYPVSIEPSPVALEPESEENLAEDVLMQEGIPQSVEDDQVVETDYTQVEQHPFHEELSPAAMTPEFEENRAEGAEPQEEIQQYVEDDQVLETDDALLEQDPVSIEPSPVALEPESEENLAEDVLMQEGIPQSVEDDQVVETDYQQVEQHPFHEELSPAAMTPEFEENRAEGAEPQEGIQQYVEDDQVLETDDALLEQDPVSIEPSPVALEPESEENQAEDVLMQEGIPQSVEDDQVVETDYQQVEQHPFHEELSPAAIRPESEEAVPQEEVQQYVEDDRVLETDDDLLEQHSFSIVPSPAATEFESEEPQAGDVQDTPLVDLELQTQQMSETEEPDQEVGAEGSIEKEDLVETANNVPQAPPPEAVFDEGQDLSHELDDSLENRLETDDSLEVKVGTTDDHSLEAVSDDKDAYQEKEGSLVLTDMSDSEREDKACDMLDDSLEMGAKEPSDSLEPLSDGSGQKDLSHEEAGAIDIHSTEDRSEEIEGGELGSDQLPEEVTPPEAAGSEEHDVSPVGEAASNQQEDLLSDHNQVDICIESAPAAVDTTKYPVDRERRPEEEGTTSEVRRIFGQPEPRLLHDDHYLITESQNTSDGVMEIEDVSAASEEIPVDVVSSESSSSSPMVSTPITPIASKSIPAMPAALVKKELTEEPKEIPKKNGVAKKGAKVPRKSGLKKPGESKVTEPPKDARQSRTTTKTAKPKTTSLVKKSDLEKQKPEGLKQPSTRKSLDKKAPTKKTATVTKKEESKTMTNGRTQKAPAAAKPSRIGVRTETRRPIGSARSTPTKKAETQRPGQTGKATGTTKRLSETTKRTATTTRTGRTQSARGDSSAGSSRKPTSATKTTERGKTPAIPVSGPAVYVDLAYIPNHGAVENANSEFFRRIRSSFYVLSGEDKSKNRPHVKVLDALLEGKLKWEDSSVGTTVIPTQDLYCLTQWRLDNREEITKANIDIGVSASRAIVSMRDENFFMYNVEFNKNDEE